ncbi:SulP family inorganic anion transporter [Aggregicoccus sp. 17bor-14]|uniref:SulP family inorganic anion transporter n=1 Tax=Myxococcaceae TaxID=31 RepID=UPI00351A43E9
MVAGLVNGVASVPSGLATAAMAGVNPVFGLYAVTVAPAAGGLVASSQLMQVATTGAAALTASQGISRYPGAQRSEALFLLVALAGAFLVLFGLLKAGRLLRYVSFPVMSAFLSGVAVVLVFDQTAQLVGYSPEARTSLGEFVDLLLHLGEIHLPSAVVGLLGLALILGLLRTPLGKVSTLVGLVVPTVLVVLWRPAGVQLVSDVSEIPRGLPPLGLPDFRLFTPGLLLSAFALAVVIAIQGAGISQSYGNPDGTRADPSRDMLAQGVANVLGSLVSGMPTGGSVGQTALNVSAGAKSRLAGVFHSAFMLVIILLVPGLVGRVPMPALASVMVVAGYSAIRFGAMGFIWRTGGPGRWVLAVTFLATLVLSISQAVALGVVCAVVLYLYSSASHLRLQALEPQEDGEVHVVEVPERLADRSITVLDVHGSLFFAAARRLRELLPRPEGSERPVVVLRLRGNSQVGTTSIEVLNDYAHALADAGGRLYLSGMTDEVSERLERAHRLELDEEVSLFPATHVLGGSTRDAVSAARDFLRQSP